MRFAHDEFLFTYFERIGDMEVFNQYFCRNTLYLRAYTKTALSDKTKDPRCPIKILKRIELTSFESLSSNKLNLLSVKLFLRCNCGINYCLAYTEDKLCQKLCSSRWCRLT